MRILKSSHGSFKPDFMKNGHLSDFESQTINENQITPTELVNRGSHGSKTLDPRSINKGSVSTVEKLKNQYSSKTNSKTIKDRDVVKTTVESFSYIGNELSRQIPFDYLGDISEPW